MSPARILKINVIAYAAAQTVASAALLGAILTNDRRVIIAFLANAAIAPIFAWGTYRACRTSWLGLPPNDLRDGTIPAAIVIMIAIALWAVIPVVGLPH